MGETARAWLRAINDSSREETLRFYQTRCAKNVLQSANAEWRRDHAHAARATEGRYHLRAVLETSATRIVFLLEAERAETVLRVTLSVRLGSPARITELLGEGTSYAPAGEHPVRNDDDAVALLDEYVTRLEARDLFSGVVAIARGGTIFYERAAGLASRAFGIPNRLDTRFNLGAMTKMFTAVAIAKLVDEGRLAYTDTLATAWPRYGNRSVAERVSVHQLLTHTSGLTDYLGDDYRRISKDRLRTIEDYLPLFIDAPLASEPGERFRYSNAGYIVLGGVIERVSGTNYVDYIRDSVFEPAGMPHSDFFEMDVDTPNRAVGYTDYVVGANVPSDRSASRNNLYAHPVRGGPDAGAYSTVRDLVTFAEALLSGKLVSPAEVTKLVTPRGSPEARSGYGFEFGAFDGHCLVVAGGRQAGLNSHLTLVPDAGLAIVALANMGPHAAERVGSCARRWFVR